MLRVWAPGLLAPLVLNGCAVFSTAQTPDSPAAPVVERSVPENPAEALLQRMAGLPAGQPVALEGEVWTPGRLYSAASGRLCRSVEVDSRASGSETRLACRSEDGDAAVWAWYPVVAP